MVVKFFFGQDSEIIASAAQMSLVPLSNSRTTACNVQLSPSSELYLDCIQSSEKEMHNDFSSERRSKGSKL